MKGVDFVQKYIGTKLIEAEPAKRGECYKGHNMLSAEEAARDGYRVLYSDGYVSWSPKDTFEESYRPTDGMSFGLAIEAAKKGKKIQRAGWNGKNQYVELATRIGYMNVDGVYMNVEHEAIGNKAFAFVGTSGVQLGWLASQADMLADDWRIVE